MYIIIFVFLLLICLFIKRDLSQELRRVETTQVPPKKAKLFKMKGRFLKLDVNKWTRRASLVAQWLRIHLPMQGTRVRALVREDPTCRGATKPVRCNYWACTLQPASHNYWAHVPQLLKPTRLEPRALQQEKPMQWEARTPQWRVAPAHPN